MVSSPAYGNWLLVWLLEILLGASFGCNRPSGTNPATSFLRSKPRLAQSLSLSVFFGLLCAFVLFSLLLAVGGAASSRSWLRHLECHIQRRENLRSEKLNVFPEALLLLVLVQLVLLLTLLLLPLLWPGCCSSIQILGRRIKLACEYPGPIRDFTEVKPVVA